MKTIFDAFDTASENGWRPHPAFEGVFLKALLTGEQTDGRFSSHLVRIDPGKAIGVHDHPDHWELHEVTEGEGVCNLLNEDIPYAPGCSTVMPRGEAHSVTAGEKGLKLLAKFIPALL